MVTVIRSLVLVVLIAPVGLVYSQTASSRVAVVGGSLASAIAAYARASNDARVDCDPVGDGRWVCANFNNPTLADVSGTANALPDVSVPQVSEPVVRTPAASAPVVQAPVNSVQSNGRAAVVAGTLEDARANLASLTGSGRGPGIDCDPVDDGRWVCANFNNPTLADAGAQVTFSSTPANPAPATAVSQPTSTSPASTPATGNANAREAIPSGSAYRSGDLIVMQYDSCPDPDDIHAAVAGKMVLDHFGFVNGRDYIVTNGTCGVERPRSDYIQRSPEIFNQLYGNSWNDAFNDEANSAVRVAEMIREALNEGRNVHVMDGGPMDFTARVVRQVEANGVSNLRRISVYQHSSIWNSRFTGDNNLSYLVSRVNYVDVPDGNRADNGTAQLNQQNTGRNGYSRVDGSLVNRFRNNDVYGNDWREAFSLFNPDNRFDGSDTVELLWLLNLRDNRIADWYEFADRFLPGNTQGSAAPVTEAVSQPASQAPVTTSDNVVRFEAESVSIGSGWVRETARSGFSGTGYIRWNGGNRYSNPGQGTTRYSFSVASSGVYQLRIKARAISPPRDDLNNDSWFRMNGQNVSSIDFTQWTKVFTSGQDNWQTAGRADVSPRQPFSQQLQAGRTYVLELSGRSQNHAIDVIELVRQ